MLSAFGSAAEIRDLPHSRCNWLFQLKGHDLKLMGSRLFRFGCQPSTTTSHIPCTFSPRRSRFTWFAGPIT